MLVLQKAREIDAWLWEKYTTNYIVEEGEWRLVGEVPTPWPCFVLVAHDSVCKERQDDLLRLLELTKPVCQRFKANINGDTVQYVSENHRLSPALSENWLATADWACDANVPHKALADAVSFLQRVGQIDGACDPTELVADFTKID